MRSSCLTFLCFFAIHFASAQGDFAPAVELPFTGNGTRGDFGDIDGDGDNDVVFSTTTYMWLYVLYNDEGKFTRFEKLIAPREGSYIHDNNVSGQMAIALHDMDSDGVSDIVVGRWKDNITNEVSIFSYKAGNFEEIKSIPISAGFQATQIQCADLNGDHQPDIILSADFGSISGDGRWLWELESKSDGTYREVKIITEVNVSRSLLADIDLDGSIDLIVANYSGTTLSINKNVNGTFVVGDRLHAWGSAYDFNVADFNGDGRPDIVVANVSGGLEFFPQSGFGTFEREWQMFVDPNQRPVPSDVDNDGDLDIVFATRASQAARILLNDGEANFVEQRFIQLGAWAASVAVADVDGDDIPEILPFIRGSNIEIFKMGEEAYESYTNFIYSPNPTARGLLANMNNDGKSDLVLLHTEAKAISIAHGTGDNEIFDEAVYFRTGDSFPSQLEKGDFNNDSYTDIMYVCLENESNAGSAAFGIIYGSEDGQPDHVQYDPRANVNSWRLHIADFNNDGNDDFLSGSIFISDGDGSFTEQVVTNANVIDGSTVGDFNNDGRIDLAFATPVGVKIQMNKGNGSFEGQFQFETPDIDMTSISAADVNADGFDDIIYYNATLKDVVVMLNLGSGNFVKTSINFPNSTIWLTQVVSDIDNDGVPELLLFRFGEILAYHVALDSPPKLVQTITLPWLLFGRRAIAGLINSDDMPDIVFINHNYPSAVMLSNVLVDPTISPSVVVSDITKNSAKLSFTGGDGDGRILIIREGSPVSAVLSNNNFYTGDPRIGAGNHLGSSNYVIVSGNETSVTITGLNEETTYHYSLIESNKTDVRIKYLTSAATVGSFKTKATPIPQAQTITFEIATKTLGDANFILDGTSSSGLPLNYELVSGGVTISGNTVTIIKAGTAKVRASQGGNDEFLAAFNEVEFCINPKKPELAAGVENGNDIIISNSLADDITAWYLDGVVLQNTSTKKLIPAKSGVYTTTSTASTCTSALSDPFNYVKPPVSPDPEEPSIPEEPVTPEEPPVVVGLNEPAYEVIVLPNPASDRVFVRLPAGSATKIVSIQTPDGRERERKETNLNELQFDVADYAQGIYLVRISTASASIIIRFVKN